MWKFTGKKHERRFKIMFYTYIFVEAFLFERFMVVLWISRTLAMANITGLCYNHVCSSAVVVIPIPRVVTAQDGIPMHHLLVRYPCFNDVLVSVCPDLVASFLSDLQQLVKMLRRRIQQERV